MNIHEAVYCIVDIETTGLDPVTDRIVEIACVATSAYGVLGMWASLVDGRPCNPTTSAIHGLTDADLEGAPSWMYAHVDLSLFTRSIAGEKAIIVAHNAQFDKSFVEPTSEGWLCTKRLAQHLFPNAPSSSNQVLRYYRNLKVDTFGVLPHRALADCLVTAALLRDELETCSAPPFGASVFSDTDELLAFADSPILLLNMPMGKHRGPIADVPKDYIEWALGPRGMTDMDPDLKYTLETELAKRRANA